MQLLRDLKANGIAVDGKHIAIQKPKGSRSQYYNYKHFCSVVLMAVVDSNYEFIMVDVGANGRMSDGAVITNTKFGQLLDKGELNIPPPKIMPNSNINCHLFLSGMRHLH